MAELSDANLDGDTELQISIRFDQDVQRMNIILNLGADVHNRNNLGKSPLHTAAKYSKLGIECFKPLLKNGASVYAFDYNGNSPLHDLFHNPSISIDMIELLLYHGAHPDVRNVYDLPPVFFVQTSGLSDLEKSYATKLLIHYTIVKKTIIYKKINDQTKNDAILSLIFCEDTQRRLALTKIRDQCVKEMIQMQKYNIKENYSLCDMLYDYCHGLLIIKKHTDKLIIENLTGLVIKNEYPGFQDMLISCALFLNIDSLVQKLHIYTVKPSSNDIVQLNFECNKAVISFLSKVDVSNLITAFSKA